MIVMIDNYDSFTYNLVQYFGQLGEQVRTFRNDTITPYEIEKLEPDLYIDFFSDLPNHLEQLFSIKVPVKAAE